MPLTTAIARHTNEGLVVRGLDLTTEVVGSRTFTEMLHLLVCGRLPNHAETAVLDACLVTLMEGGINASTVVARVTAEAQPAMSPVAMAAGLLTVGDKYAGSAQGCGELLVDLVAHDIDKSSYCRELVREHRARRAAVPGFGHGTHSTSDPRAERLLAIASDAGIRGEYSAALDRLSAVMDEEAGRHIVVNVTGAMAAVLLDCGIPVDALAGLAAVARCGGLLGHVVESVRTGSSGPMWQSVRDAVQYVPPPEQAEAH